MEKIIGRERELLELQSSHSSEKSEFVVVYGRRRIGKTFLVRSFFKDRYDFHYVGGHKLNQKRQLQNFALALQQHSGAPFLPELKDWYDAFNHLQKYIETLPENKRKVIFIDEMPWIDHAKSNFVAALENFWNSWVSNRDDIFFVACGSATSWMVDKLIMNQGGLHNRITKPIYLRPFTLKEVESYMESKGGHWDRFQLTQTYMALGGVPYYLSLLDYNKSLVQNMDNLFFVKNGQLQTEFDELYSALFSQSDRYISVVRALYSKRAGLTRDEVANATGLAGGGLSKILSNLEKCDFIVSYVQFGNKRKNTIYRLSDFYTLFYLRFVEGNKTQDAEFWAHNINTPTVNSWQGLTFELVCMLHLEQIKKALGIYGISTNVSCWRSEDAQIDLLIDRSDRMINLCEMKFSNEPYIITKDYEMKLRTRLALFKEATRSRSGLIQTFVTTYGVAQGKHSSVAQCEITMDELFS